MTFKKGYIMSAETKKKLSDIQKRRLAEGKLKIPNNKGRRGQISWNKGLKGYTNKGSFQKGHAHSKETLSKISAKKKGQEYIRKLPSSIVLKELYCDRKMSCVEIAHIYNVHPNAVAGKLKRRGVYIRNASESHTGKKLSAETKLKMSKAGKGRIFSEIHKDRIAKALTGRKHTEEDKLKAKLRQLGKRHSEETKLKMSEARTGEKNHFYGKQLSADHRSKLSTAHMGKHPSEETRLKISGANNVNWLGGKSYEPYTFDFNKRFKRIIKARDGWCCVVCGKTNARGGLDIHHVDYNKLNSFPQNCASLCKHCHGSTNSNRHHWKIFLQNILKERYGYEYTEDQRIISNFVEGMVFEQC